MNKKSDKMARIGKCKVKDCNGEISTGSYADWTRNVDGVGFCNKCFKEYPLEYKGKSMNLTLFTDRLSDF